MQSARPVSSDPTEVGAPLWTRGFALLCLFTFVTFFAAFQLFPTAPLRLRALGADLAESGRFMAAFTLGSSLGALVTGPIGDHLGHRRTIRLSAVFFTAVMAAYALVQNRLALYLLAPIHGLFWSAMITSISALLGSVLSETRRAEGLSLFGLASPAGVLFGPAAGLWLFQRVGFSAMCLGLGALFALLALTGGALPEGRLTTGSTGPRWEFPERSTLLLSSVLFFLALGFGAVNSYSAQEGLALGLRWPSAFLSSSAVGMALMRLYMARAGFGKDPVRLLPRMVGLGVLGLALLAVAPIDPLYRHVLAALPYGAGYSMVHTLLNTALLEKTPPSKRAAAFGSFMFAFDAGIGIGSFSIGALIGRAGYAPGWVASALLLACALPIAWNIVGRGVRARETSRVAARGASCPGRGVPPR